MKNTRFAGHNDHLQMHRLLEGPKTAKVASSCVSSGNIVIKDFFMSLFFIAYLVRFASNVVAVM